MKKKPVFVGIGELLWDMLPEGKKAGGAPINFVYHATQLGAEGYAVSSVGKDVLGDEILKELDKKGIRYLIERTPFPTGQVLVELGGAGVPDYTILENVAWDHIPFTEAAVELVRRADTVCFGTLAQRSPESGETIRKLLRQVPESAFRFFDINMRQHYYSKEIIERSLELSNVFKVNEDEFAVLKGMFGAEGTEKDVCLKFIERFGLRYMILTAGASYSAVYSADEFSVIPTPAVEVADTVGAGDSFSGAFIFSLISGKSLSEAHRFAVRIAAFVSSEEGAWPSYEGKESLLEI